MNLMIILNYKNMYLKYIFSFITMLVGINTENIENPINDIIIGPQNYSVFDKGLCVKRLNKWDILDNYRSYYVNTSDNRVMTGILGFLESSNNNSFKEAYTFASKFSMLSPFQLHIKRTGLKKYEIFGTDLIKINRKWMKNLSKTTRKDIKIVPLMTFTDWKVSDFFSLAISNTEMIKLSTELLRVCEKNQIHGLILDMWPQFYEKVPMNLLIMLIQEISARLRFNFKLALLLIPPMYANKEVLSQELFENLTDYVNYMILQVYDYSSAWKPGPNSPVYMVEDFVKYLTPDPLVRRNNILIGVNFFGNMYTYFGIKKIFRNEYIELLKKYDGELDFDERALEHYFDVMETDGKRIIYYPSLYSVYTRVRLANKLGIGFAIVEVGQGLEYFYDVL